MSPSDLRSKFLAEASQLLSTTSPMVAAALAVERFAMDGSLSQQQSRHQETRCLACGNANIKIRTIWPKHNISDTRKGKAKRPAHINYHHRKLIRVCRSCKRVLTLDFSAPEKPTDLATASKLGDLPCRQNLVLSKDAERIPIKSTNTNSKKRAKARREGLQALLNKTKQDAKPAQTFTLTDFMLPK